MLSAPPKFTSGTPRDLFVYHMVEAMFLLSNGDIFGCGECLGRADAVARDALDVNWFRNALTLLSAARSHAYYVQASTQLRCAP